MSGVRRRHFSRRTGLLRALEMRMRVQTLAVALAAALPVASIDQTAHGQSSGRALVARAPARHHGFQYDQTSLPPTTRLALANATVALANKSAVVVVFGLHRRSFGCAWPEQRRRLVKPLEALGVKARPRRRRNYGTHRVATRGSATSPRAATARMALAATKKLRRRLATHRAESPRAAKALAATPLAAVDLDRRDPSADDPRGSRGGSAIPSSPRRRSPRRRSPRPAPRLDRAGHRLGARDAPRGGREGRRRALRANGGLRLRPLRDRVARRGERGRGRVRGAPGGYLKLHGAFEVRTADRGDAAGGRRGWFRGQTRSTRRRSRGTAARRAAASGGTRTGTRRPSRARTFAARIFFDESRRRRGRDVDSP